MGKRGNFCWFWEQLGDVIQLCQAKLRQCLPLTELWLGTVHQYERQKAGSSGSCHALANQTMLQVRVQEPSAHHLCDRKETSVSEK